MYCDAFLNLCFCGKIFLYTNNISKSQVTSLNISVAIMLRNACAGAVYEKCFRTSVQNKVSSYQSIMFCAEDGEAIMEMVLKGSLLGALTIGIMMCIFCGFFTIGFHAIWAFSLLTILLVIAVWTYNFIRNEFI